MEASIEELSRKIKESQIVMLPGGFSAGDEPDGSGKFITNILQNPKVKAAIKEFLAKEGLMLGDGSGKFITNILQNPKVKAAIKEFLAKEGLMLGICNGFQALIKSGLLPYGDMDKLNENSPTLFRNDINRHVSRIATTRIASNSSPWLSSFEIGDMHSMTLSHGEGKFVVSEEFASGLLPYGDMDKLNENSPTLFRNDINRHVSRIATTRIASNSSPWLSSFEIGDMHSMTLSHGEGKFVVSEEFAKELFENGQVATQYCNLEGEPTMDGKYNLNGSCYAVEGIKFVVSEEFAKELFENGQVATQYCNLEGEPTMDGKYNLNGSCYAVEGITSKDGHIFGKMGHSERYEDGIFKNIYGEKMQDIFQNGVNSCYAVEGITSKDGHIFGKMGHSERYEDGIFKNIYGEKMQDIFQNGVNFFKK